MYFSTGSQLSTALGKLADSKVGQFLAFDALYYSNTYMLNGNTTALTPIEHFVQYGAAAMAKPNATFDPVYYKQHYADLAATNLNSADLLYHFMQFGLDEGRVPNADLAAKFNATAYLAKYPDVAAYVNANLASFGGSASNGALAHYVKFGVAQGFTLPAGAPTGTGTTFNLADSTAVTNPDLLAVKTMHLTGDMDVRVDITNKANQITGLDLNGNGIIALDGKENALNVHPASGYAGSAANYVAVDAYPRLTNGVMDQTNLANVFLGDIAYDGTGYGGDGVKTNGNIVLGGLGADTILGGIGNDFLAGGGMAQSRSAQELTDWLASGFTQSTFVARAHDNLQGGRNADFMFVELSLLSATDGNQIIIDGGNTSDNTVAGANGSQDSDWVLLQASDDDEPVTVNLFDGRLPVGGANSSISTRAGQVAHIQNIENVDASGNLYGFLKGMNTTIGGAPSGATNPNNDGIGSTGQLVINGSFRDNKLIGGYDNDRIDGGFGNDLLMGGNLNKLINPNSVGIVTDGADVLLGWFGNDNIAFEADRGGIDGGFGVDTDGSGAVSFGDTVGSDTLWITAKSLGTGTAASVLAADATLRFDLLAQDINAAAGYGGADVDGTQDQTKYLTTTGIQTGRVTVTNMENVIATGLGAVDFAAAGTNTPELGFDNIQNFQRYTGDMDLRGTGTANTLYATNGNDKLEGRQGNDLLSGGDGNDDFTFNLAGTGDGVDTIHRQADANNDNLWDGYNSITGAGGDFVQDFGVNSTVTLGASALTVDFGATNLASPDVDLASFSIKIGGVTFAVTDATAVASLKAAASVAEVAAIVNTAFHTQDANINVVATGSKVIITDTLPAGGRVMSSTVAEGYGVSFAVSNGAAQANASFGPAVPSVSLDRLIYQSYFDRLDGEKTHDDAVIGTAISLGVDAYAEDLVINFAADGTRIAEDQGYTIDFSNLTTRDMVTVAVNGVTYTLTVGVDLDGNAIAAEDGVGDVQPDIQHAFLYRLNEFINTFMDNDTAVGQVFSQLRFAVAPAVTTNAIDLDLNGLANGVAVGGTPANEGAGSNLITGLRLQQVQYSGEQTVFMTLPVVTLVNASNGELPAKAVVTNVSQHEVLLYNFDGRGNNLNSTNVLFLGDTNANRATLETAKAAGQVLAGTNAVLVDGGVDDLAGVTVNTANNNPLLLANYSVHGDDFLLGGDGADTITGGTGDDRIQGSKGTDTLDGGKNLYAVKVLDEEQARVITWNAWEAANPTSAQALLADPTLAGKVYAPPVLIGQSENGANVVSGAFDDTLVYAQADFTASTRFTVTLDDFKLNGTVVDLNNGGAGKVYVDLTGNGLTADDSTSAFTNFENIRTVSGTGVAVAGANGGQGNDTLDVSALSTATGGVQYNLTNDGNFVADSGGVLPGWVDLPGYVRYSNDAHLNDGLAVPLVKNPVTGDFESFVIKVDGVESVIAGLGDDLLLIDESEAAKDNTFTASLGEDRIEYRNVFSATPATEALAEPTVTIKVNTANDQDKVEMTAGRVGTVLATDTLNSVEYITLANGTATGNRENDVVDVRAMVNGATVSYVDGTVKNETGVTQVTIGGINQMEKVIAADAKDTVIVGDHATMAANVRADVAGATVANELSLATYLDYDNLNAVTGKRIPFLGQSTAVIHNAINQNEFTFDLGKESDTVDYSKTSADQIVAVVRLNPTGAVQQDQYVLVGTQNASLVDLGDRVDHLVNVENVVASQAKSTLDLTGSDRNLKISFSNNYDAASAASWNSTYNAAYGREIHSIKVADGTTGTSVVSMNYLDYVFVDTNTADTIAPATDARWTGIQGSDFNEYVEMTGYEAEVVNTLDLRGGTNTVTYEGKKIALVLNVDATANLITASIDHYGLKDDHNATTVDVVKNAVDVITSYSAQNPVAAGSLTIKATRDPQDSVSFNAGLTSPKFFVFGGVTEAVPSIVVKVGSGAAANSINLIGFETIADSGTSDVYDFVNLLAISPTLKLSDLVGTNDHDTLKVNDTAAALAYDGDAPSAISLTGLQSSTFIDFTVTPFDFDVLDVSAIPAANGTITTLNGLAAGEGTDEVVIGNFASITTVNDFEAVVLTQDAVTQNGDTYVLNTTANKLVAGLKTLTFNNNMNVLSFGGTSLEATFGANTLLNATGAVKVSAFGAENVTLIGGNGNDTLTGAAGSDTLLGGAGDDALNAGVAQEVHTFTMVGNLGNASATFALDFMNAGTAFSTITENVEFATGATADVVGAAAVLKWNADLVTLNTLFDADPSSNITSVSYSAGKLAFNFAPGYDVVTNVNLGAAVNYDVVDSENATFISSVDVVNGGTGGNNVMRGGEGKDTLNGGAGNDTFVVVGSIDTTQSAIYSNVLNYPNQTFVDGIVGGQSGVINLTRDLKAKHDSTDVTAGDTYVGGGGVDKLLVFGVADMTTSVIGAGIATIEVHSKVSFTKAQLDAMLVLDLEPGSEIIVSDATSGADALAALNKVSLITGALPTLKFYDANGDAQTQGYTAAALLNENVSGDGYTVFVNADQFANADFGTLLGSLGVAGVTLVGADGTGTATGLAGFGG